MLCEPWLIGPRAKPWRLMVPWKPLPLDVALTWTLSPASKTPAPMLSPTSPVTPRSSLRCLRGGRIDLGEGACLWLVDPARVYGPEADLHGLVAVVFGGADGRDHVRLDLDDGDADERPVVQEGLGHPSLASEYCRCHNPTSPLSLCSRQPAGRAAVASRPCAAWAAGCL